jgi:hypothetical protein
LGFFFGDPGIRVIEALKTYQNEDGGFGHALEPDLRARESQPLFVEFALRTLSFCGLRAPHLAEPARRFVSQYANLEEGIPTLLPASQAYSRAFHWHDPQALLPSVDRPSRSALLAVDRAPEPQRFQAFSTPKRNPASQAESTPARTHKPPPLVI